LHNAIPEQLSSENTAVKRHKNRSRVIFMNEDHKQCRKHNCADYCWH